MKNDTKQSKPRRANSDDIVAMFELMMERLSAIEQALNITAPQIPLKKARSPKLVDEVMKIMEDGETHSTVMIADHLTKKLGREITLQRVSNLLSSQKKNYPNLKSVALNHYKLIK